MQDENDESELLSMPNNIPLLTGDIPEPSQPIALWKIYLILGILVTFLFGGSAIICGSDNTCRNHIPTVANMLNSTLTTPFVITGFNVALVTHMLTVCGISIVAYRRAPYWTSMQVTAALLTYAATILTLFILPFTGWFNNWANVGVLVCLNIWMLVAQMAIYRGLRNTYRWQLWGMTLLYTLCLIPYIVVRAVPTLPIPNKDIGLLVCQIVGGVSLVLFLSACITHVWKVRVRLYHPESKVD